MKKNECKRRILFFSKVLVEDAQDQAKLIMEIIQMRGTIRAKSLMKSKMFIINRSSLIYMRT